MVIICIYFIVTGILVDSAEEEVRLGKKQLQRMKRVAKSSELSRLQERMLKLLSKLDSATCLSMLNQPASAVAWCTEPIITLKLPCPDQRPTICIGKWARNKYNHNYYNFDVYKINGITFICFNCFFILCDIESRNYSLFSLL